MVSKSRRLADPTGERWGIKNKICLTINLIYRDLHMGTSQLSAESVMPLKICDFEALMVEKQKYGNQNLSN